MSRVLVIGPGAIGTYIAGLLTRAGHSVVLWAREGSAAILREHGIHLEGLPEPIHLAPEAIQVVTTPQAAREHGPYQATFLTVKAYHLPPVLEALRELGPGITPVVDLLNGVGSTEALQQVLGAEHVIPGTVTTPVRRVRAGHAVVESLRRGIGLARTHPRAAAIATWFRAAGARVQTYADGRALKWSKLIANLLGNATSAILDMRPQAIYAHPGLYRLERAQVLEAARVIRGLGLPLVDLPGVPVRLLVAGMRWLPGPVVRPILARKIGGGRGEKWPSIHQDVHAGRLHTEVDVLNGAVVRHGRALGLPTPTNQLLTELVHDLVQGRRSLDAFRRRPEALLALWEARRDKG
ncbi:MAG: ketopantoate reductase family protein [Chloroflexi bacterium]|nr:ketopantoate reductase family protein [Chloroflexota bacterium]